MIRIPGIVPRQERIRAMNEAAAFGVSNLIVERLAIVCRMASVMHHVSLAAAALRMVQKFGYNDEWNDNGDLYQTFRETLDRGGDCKALSTLLVSVLLKLGYRAQVAWIEHGDEPLDHVAVLVKMGDAWWWAEPSIDGANLGEAPHDAMRRLGISRGTADRERKRALFRALDG